MNARLVDLLKQLRAEADSLPQRLVAPEYIAWKSRVHSTFTKALGPRHPIIDRFLNIQWSGRYGGTAQDWFLSGLGQAVGLINAAIYELEELNAFEDGENDTSVDPELWDHISKLVAAEAWGQVASQTAIFTEDRIRKWTGRPAQEVGERLMTAVFGEQGEYRLGLTTGEKNGWHRFAMGISMALRNADAHRIQDRPDHKRYAMGVVGASSLLLTQLRYEHGNRFHDQSSVSPEPVEPVEED
ncbi:TIGR02391 family protein [Actinophytocola sp. NPDC049390]|uniref:TIGR02391 family protein n=1 Tax=Actinophytocola sp. NPDC049390 TaxID=3363894 RepID=UPI0037919246